MELKLADRVFIVTGGSRGIGKAAVVALLHEGAHVVACARSEEPLQVLSDQASALSGELICMRADVTCAEQVDTLVSNTIFQFGRIDGVLVNAGQGTTGTLLEVNPADIISQIDTKVLSALYTVKTALPYLEKSDAPRVVIVNGTTAHSPEIDMGAVSCARAALANASVLLAQELAPRGICVNRLTLGPINTQRQYARFKAGGSSDDYATWQKQEAIRRGVPLGRFGEAEEIVPWILLALSPLASFMTGAEVTLSGGLGMRV